MKKILILASSLIVFFSTMEAQAITLINEAGDDVTFAIQTPQLASVHADVDSIESMIPGTKKVSILQLLMDARAKIQTFPKERDAYMKFVAKFGKNSDTYNECKLYFDTGSEGWQSRNERWLFLRNMSDAVLAGLDQKLTITALRDGTCVARQS